MMALGSIEIKTAALESKLKIAYKHLGNLITELETVCSNCGSTNTKIITAEADNAPVYKIKECSCGEKEYVEINED